MNILAISGSLRRASYNTSLLRAAAELAPDGVEVTIYEGLALLPPYDEDLDTDHPDAEVTRLREQIAASDAILLSTPEFNGTMPGQMKQVVDWGSRPYGKGSSLWGRPAAVIGASVTDYGAIWAQDHLRKALGIAGARVLDVELPVAKAQERFDADGVLTDLELRDRLVEILDELVQSEQRLTAAA